MRTTIRKKIAIMLAVAGTMLLLSSGVAFAVQIINCERGHACVGTPKSDSMRGTQGSDRMSGRDSKDVMRGNSGKDTMRGAEGNDVIKGGNGNDTTLGGPGNDTMNAGADNDSLDGGPGNDIMNAGGGDDTIMANDGELDSISCGLGTDVVFVDQEDLDAENTNFEDFIRLTSCETINEPEIQPTTE